MPNLIECPKCSYKFEKGMILYWSNSHILKHYRSRRRDGVKASHIILEISKLANRGTENNIWKIIMDKKWK